MKATRLIIGAMILCCFTGMAAPLTKGTFKEIINEVAVVSTSGSATPAAVDQTINAPDRVRTGPQSRAELIAPDQTITRVGANTIFSFADNGRTLNLEQGNVLFHAPKGLGGGVIKSGAASAAVLGTTLIVSATADGGFKVILLEGTGRVVMPDGTAATLKAGQLVFVLPGGKLSPVLTINLGRLVGGSQLVNGFSDQLASLPLINDAIRTQNAQLKSGKAVDTGRPPDTFLNLPAPGNGLNTVDHGTYQTAAPPPTPPMVVPSANGVFVLQPNGGGRGITPVPPGTVLFAP
jgi:hypothetical protein